LPAPFCPTKPIAPGSTDSDKSSSASTEPYR